MEYTPRPGPPTMRGRCSGERPRKVGCCFISSVSRNAVARAFTARERRLAAPEAGRKAPRYGARRRPNNCVPMIQGRSPRAWAGEARAGHTGRQEPSRVARWRASRATSQLPPPRCLIWDCSEHSRFSSPSRRRFSPSGRVPRPLPRIRRWSTSMSGQPEPQARAGGPGLENPGSKIGLAPGELRTPVLPGFAAAAGQPPGPLCASRAW
jgi:hypothetical protein